MPLDAGMTEPSRIARAVSLVLALAISGVLFVYPRLLGAELAGWQHGVLAMMMLGVSAGFTHGVGFVPRPRPLRFLFGPWFGWPAMIVGAVFLAWPQQ